MARPHGDPDLLRKTVFAVMELVAHEGVDAASMRLVAARTGLSTGTLNYHFGNKAGLLAAALDYAYREPPGWSAEGLDAAARLGAVLARYVLRRRRVLVWWRFFVAVSAYAAKDRRVAARLGRHQERLVDYVASLVAAAGQRRAGEARREAERLMALAHGAALRQLLEPRPARFAWAEALFAAELRALV